jgi:hypothetical protein
MTDSSRQLDLANEMKAAAPAPRLGPEFNAFLFSAIGEGRNGMPLSVVSLLARRDLDPWLEATSLAAMPADAAARRLDSLIRSLPDQPLTLPDSRTIATRLIALLPRRTGPNIRAPEKQARTTAADADAVALRRRSIVVAMILVICILFLMGAHFATTSNESSTRPVATDTPPSPITPAQTHPPPSEK